MLHLQKTKKKHIRFDEDRRAIRIQISSLFSFQELSRTQQFLIKTFHRLIRKIRKILYIDEPSQMYPERHSIAKRRSSIRLLPFLFFKLSPADITYQRYRCSLDPVETGARNDRRSNYRDQHFQRYLRSDCGLASVEIVPIVRFAWSLEEDSVPADKYGARFEGKIEKKRGIQKIEGKEDLAFVASYPYYTLVPIIKQSARSD